MGKPICSYPNCDTSVRARNLCGGHYAQWAKGKPLTPIIRNPEERFWLKVDKSDDCWIWLGAKDPLGYGRCGADGKLWLAHRRAYMLLIGPIPDGLDLDHLCRNPPCVNPAHLEPVSHRTNLLRGVGVAAQYARRTHCVHGHELTEDNIYPFLPGSTARRCKTCQLENNRRRDRKKATSAVQRKMESQLATLGPGEGRQ